MVNTIYSEERLAALLQLQTTCDLVVTPIVISAIELTIVWNGIPDTDQATTPAQLIPLVLGVVLVTMVLAQLWIDCEEGSNREFTLFA